MLFARELSPLIKKSASIRTFSFAKMATTTEKILTLKDGRAISYREYGDLEGGYPVLFFHGNMNSRMFWPAWEKTLDQTVDAGARVIALDRPGYGKTSLDWDKRTYLQWGQDVGEFCDTLGLESYATVGFSSGGPHSLACAASNLKNMKCCAVVSPDAPYNLLGLCKKMFGAEELSKELCLSRAKHTYEDLENSYKSMKKEHRREMALEDLKVAVESGLSGPSSDTFLESRPWGFDVKDISIPTYLWFGRKDESVPFVSATHLMNNLGNLQRALIVGSESHTMIRRYWRDILNTVVKHPEKSVTGKRLTRM